jgi:F-type H+-transporting ATPase subunit c
MKKLLTLFLAVTSTAALAAGRPENASQTMYMGYFIGLGISACGGALGQGRAGAAALEGVARNPAASGKILIPMILAFALMESLVIFTMISVFLV